MNTTPKTVKLKADYFLGVQEGDIAKVIRSYLPDMVIALVKARERVVEIETGRIINA